MIRYWIRCIHPISFRYYSSEISVSDLVEFLPAGQVGSPIEFNCENFSGEHRCAFAWLRFAMHDHQFFRVKQVIGLSFNSESLTIFTDGSTQNGLCGFGIFWLEDRVSVCDRLPFLEEDIRSNHFSEWLAVIFAVMLSPSNANIHIFTDALYIVEAVHSMMEKPPLVPEVRSPSFLWCRIICSLLSKRSGDSRLSHVHSHQALETISSTSERNIAAGNSVADFLANTGRELDDESGIDFGQLSRWVFAYDSSSCFWSPGARVKYNIVNGRRNDFNSTLLGNNSATAPKNLVTMYNHDTSVLLQWSKWLQLAPNQVQVTLLRCMFDCGGTNVNISKWYPKKEWSPLCLRCKTVDETLDHVIVCSQLSQSIKDRILVAWEALCLSYDCAGVTPITILTQGAHLKDCHPLNCTCLKSILGSIHLKYLAIAVTDAWSERCRKTLNFHSMSEDKRLKWS